MVRAVARVAAVVALTQAAVVLEVLELLGKDLLAAMVTTALMLAVVVALVLLVLMPQPAMEATVERELPHLIPALQ
jgi:hypothetical protein